MSRVDREGLISFGAALVAALVAVTCHRGTRLDVPVAAAGPDGRATPSARSSPRAKAPSATPVPLASSIPAARAPGGLGLARFDAALVESYEGRSSRPNQ